MRGNYYAISLVLALVMLGAAIVPSTMSVNMLGTQQSPDDDNDQDQNETENETAEAPVIAGGGWFIVKAGNFSFKDTFGMTISGNKSAGSAFVLQGRDASVRVHSLNFTMISFSANNTTVNAKGWCTVNGMKGFWFNLTAKDNGSRSHDMLSLAVFKDVNVTGVMDEKNATYMWIANGLGGGQISSTPEHQEESEGADDDSGEPKGPKEKADPKGLRDKDIPRRNPQVM